MNKETLSRELNRLVKEYNATNPGIVAEKTMLPTGTYTIRFHEIKPLRNKWVSTQFRRYQNDEDVEPAYVDPKNQTVVLRSHTRGLSASLCSERDKFNEETGIAIAYAKLTGVAVPWYI